jgi:hypothetical protein
MADLQIFVNGDERLVLLFIDPKATLILNYFPHAVHGKRYILEPHPVHLARELCLGRQKEEEKKEEKEERVGSVDVRVGVSLGRTLPLGVMRARRRREVRLLPIIEKRPRKSTKCQTIVDQQL